MVFSSPHFLFLFHPPFQDHLYYSDHFPVLIPISYVPLPKPPCWYLDRADWHTFTSYSTSDIPLYFTAIPDLTLQNVFHGSKALQLKHGAWNKYGYLRGTPGYLTALLSGISSFSPYKTKQSQTAVEFSSLQV